MEKYSIDLTRDELVRVIEGLGLLMDEAQAEGNKTKRHNACVLRRQLLEIADGELAEFGGHPELVPTDEEPKDEKPEAVSMDDIDAHEHVKTVNGYIIRNDPDVEIIIQGVTSGSCMVRDYFKGTLGDVPEKLRSQEVLYHAWSIGNEMYVLCIPRDDSLLMEVQA